MHLHPNFDSPPTSAAARHRTHNPDLPRPRHWCRHADDVRAAGRHTELRKALCRAPPFGSCALDGSLQNAMLHPGQDHGDARGHRKEDPRRNPEESRRPVRPHSFPSPTHLTAAVRKSVPRRLFGKISETSSRQLSPPSSGDASPPQTRRHLSTKGCQARSLPPSLEACSRTWND